jgi:hypothetical protein
MDTKDLIRRVTHTLGRRWTAEELQREREAKAAPLPKADPEGADLERRKMLQEALLYVTQQVLEERREEIVKRAEERIAALQILRK